MTRLCTLTKSKTDEESSWSCSKPIFRAGKIGPWDHDGLYNSMVGMPPLKMKNAKLMAGAYYRRQLSRPAARWKSARSSEKETLRRIRVGIEKLENR